LWHLPTLLVAAIDRFQNRSVNAWVNGRMIGLGEFFQAGDRFFVLMVFLHLPEGDGTYDLGRKAITASYFPGYLCLLHSSWRGKTPKGDENRGYS
jgi:hypothetical protein